MFETRSRYARIEVATHRVADGREVRYVRRRILPAAAAGQTLLEHQVGEGDRLDNVAARYLGDAEAFWRICDANLTTYPTELTDEIGRSVRISLPTM
ncbi:MAG: LysM domain-containing protein [Planctomycetes bacterium]|nr:LysM domain-containing protein [Planctomycetota bacterium]